jgi:hypothetical protein
LASGLAVAGDDDETEPEVEEAEAFTAIVDRFELGPLWPNPVIRLLPPTQPRTTR